LLDQSKVVPNDFVLSEEKRIVVISGPNAGGKTVALKTLGVIGSYA
jgi:DNA mismatch repair protein MutS2